MVLAPSTTALSVVRTTSGATSSLSGEAMSELNLTSMGYPRYTVYQVTDAAKRYLARSAVPAFRYDPAGGTTWQVLTPAEIQYAGGVIILSTPLTSAAAVQVTTATYYTTITDLYGGSVARVTNGPTLVDCTLLGDAFVRRYPTIKDFSMTLDTFVMKTVASYTTNFTSATNNDIIFEHVAGGTAGNSYTIKMDNTAGSVTTASVAVTGTDVVVTLADDGKDVTSIASEIISLINNDADCRFINFAARNAASNDGTGVVEALTEQSLAGGLLATDHTAKFGVTLIVEIYFSTSADSRMEGYAYLESIDGSYDPKDVIKENLTFKGDGPLYFRPS